MTAAKTMAAQIITMSFMSGSLWLMGDQTAGAESILVNGYLLVSGLMNFPK